MDSPRRKHGSLHGPSDSRAAVQCTWDLRLTFPDVRAACRRPRYTLNCHPNPREIPALLNYKIGRIKYIANGVRHGDHGARAVLRLKCRGVRWYTDSP